jgi:hypothetical protein
MVKHKMSQTAFILEYFRKHPKKPIPHAQVVDYVTVAWKKKYGKVLRDPDRAIRKLHQSGKLTKLKKGVYGYGPDCLTSKDLEDFTLVQKQYILKRDGYRCVMCGKGEADGVELCIDHIKPKDLGGRATIGNGQVLCAAHNFLKKNYKQTETGKKMFIRLYELAKEVGDKKQQSFIQDVLKVFEDHGVNGHIIWKDKPTIQK